MIKGFLLAAILLVICMGFYAMDFLFLSRFDRKRRQGRGWAWDYTLLSSVMALLIVLQPILLPQIGWYTSICIGLVVQVLGMVTVGISFSLHIWARLYLREFYAERVEVQPDHRLIQSGPYSMMRHPVITSFFLLAIGVFLINPALTTLMVAAYTFWDFNRAARQEETLLAERISGYREYLQRTPRFLPDLWRHHDRP